MVHHCSNALNERSLSRSVLSALASHLKGRVDDGVVSLMAVYERVLSQLAAFADSWISAMRVSNVVVTDFEIICDSWTSFYKDLFKACPVDFEVKSDLLNCLSLSLLSMMLPLVTVQSRLTRPMHLSLGQVSGLRRPANGVLCCFPGFAWQGSCGRF